MPTSYDENVFVNCPFDEDYRAMMEAIVFAVHDCGFVARSSLELDDSSQVRIEKIFDLMLVSRFGIHDISRTELDPESSLPRFNMPLELGIFLGLKRAGSEKQKRKSCLILDSRRYRYQQFCSDISGQDVRAHDNDPETAIGEVRNWLRNQIRDLGTMIPGAATMQARHGQFMEVLPEMCDQLRLDRNALIFNDYTTLAAQWLKENE